jgi:hypothetical protein
MINAIKHKVQLKQANNTLKTNNNNINGKENGDSLNHKNEINTNNNNTQVNNSDKKTKEKTEEDKKTYKLAFKKNLELLKISQDLRRSNARSLLFESIADKENDFQKLGFLSTFTNLIDNSVYEKLFSETDKGGKYLSRIKSIVFNLGVSNIILFIKN